MRWRNIGPQDRGIRFFLATVLIVFSFWRESWNTEAWVLLAAGGGLLLTAFTGHSFVYGWLRLSTRRDRKEVL